LFIGAVALAGFVFAAWTPVPALARESYPRRVANWDSLVTEIVEQHSGPGDYVLAPGVPTVLVALNRRNPYPLGGPSDAVLPFLADLPSDLQLEALRAQLEQNLPKVCYFPEWFRPHQDRWHELLYDPLLRKYNYVKVNETLWYLPDTHQ
jgi:hypothetical protein